MLEAQTNCTFLSLVSLVNYGNWCGPGSNGRDPVDDVDTCCQVQNANSSHLGLFPMNSSKGTRHVLRHNWQVWIMRWGTSSLGHLPIWARCQWNTCLHRLLWRGSHGRTKKRWGGRLPLQGDWSKLSMREMIKFQIITHKATLSCCNKYHLPGKKIKNKKLNNISLLSFQACSCDVELAACIAASGHCAPPLLGITDH